MSKSNTWENGLLQLLFNNVDFTGVGDSGGLRGSVTAGSLYLSLHTSSPGESGDQTTNETSYGGYSRVAVVRSGSGWSITGNQVDLASNVDFPICTSGTATITHAAIGTAASGAGKLLYYGSVSPTIAVSTGVVPRLTTASNVTED